MKLPTFIVIGAPRAGTTSLFYWLSQHPDVFLPVRKELHHFSYAQLAAHARGPDDQRVLDELCATWEQYQAHYEAARDEAAVGEVSPSYLLHAEARHGMRERLGDLKIVAVLRDPVAKAFSQYSLLARQGREPLSFPAALEAEEERWRAGWGDIWWYARGARYAEGIARYAETFGRENLLVLRFQDLQADPAATLRTVFGFLGVDDAFAVDTSTTHNRSGRPHSRWLAKVLDGDGRAKRLVKKLVPEAVRVPLRLRLSDLNTGAKAELDDGARRRLGEYFADDVRCLEEFLGRDMGWRR